MAHRIANIAAHLPAPDAAASPAAAALSAPLKPSAAAPLPSAVVAPAAPATAAAAQASKVAEAQAKAQHKAVSERIREESWVKDSLILEKENEAQRKDTLRELTHMPYNAETPNTVLQKNFFTPQKDFYVRSHLPMPQIDAAQFRFRVAGAGLGMDISFAELKAQFPNVERAVVVQCGGNRRDEMNQMKETRGLKWKQGCIGNAVWQGVLLADVLKKAGVDAAAPAPSHRHVLFDSVDGYCVSISTAMAFSRDCVLAWAMNGEPLTRSHGAPLRVVVPGVIGARSAKYVTQLRLSAHEAQTPWQKGDYKLLPPNVGFKDMMQAFARTSPIMDMPVQSCVMTPEDGDTLPEGARSVTAVGYAYSGGGRGIRRVDVSADGGLTWQQASLHTADGSPPVEGAAEWSWVFWTAEVPLPDDGAAGGMYTLTCKAVNTANDTQPETARGIWNVRGLCNNSWQQVRLRAHQDPSLAVLGAAGERAKGAQLGVGSL